MKRKLKEYLVSRLNHFYREHDAYLCQGGNGKGYGPEMNELKNIAKHFDIKIKKEEYQIL